MGYYSNYFIKSVIRRIINVLINKKTLKFMTFVTILTIILLKIFNSTVAYGATVISDTTYYDGYEANINDMNALQNDFIVRLEGLGTESVAKNDFMSRIQTGEYALLIYYGDGTGADYNNTRPVLKKNTISLFLMPITQLEQLSTEYRNWSLNGEVICWRYRCNATYYEYKFVGNDFTYNTLGPRAAGHWYPSYLLNYKNDNLTQYIIAYFQGDTSKIIDAIENNSNNIIQNQNQNTNTIVNNQDKNTEQILNTVTDSTINENVVNTLPSNDDYIDDKTGEFLDGIFTRLMNAFTNPTVENISITVPFTNKEFSISRELIYGENDAYLHSWLKSIISLFWKFIVSLYILQDISKIIDNLRNGRFGAVESTNIKEGML